MSSAQAQYGGFEMYGQLPHTGVNLAVVFAIAAFFIFVGSASFLWRRR